LGQPRRRTEAVAVIFRPEYRERQRSARDGQNAVPGTVQDCEDTREASPARILSVVPWSSNQLAAALPNLALRYKFVAGV